MKQRVCGISKECLSELLSQGLTTREIGSIVGLNNRTVSYWVCKYGLQHLYNKPKYAPISFGKIESKEMAYILGFIIADAAVDNKNIVELSVAVEDEELMQFMSDELGCKYRKDMTLNRVTRRFPRVRFHRKINDIFKYIGGAKKKDRNVPILSSDLEVYMMRGIFDADGCITWGHRKDRNRVWHKVTYSSSLGILTAVQKILYKRVGISTIVRPKGSEDCFILEFANKPDVLRFYDYLYADKSFIPLRRKFDKFNALRLELGEIRETANESAILSEATDLSVERAETTGELNGALNHQISAQDSKELRYSPNLGGTNDKHDLYPSGFDGFHQSQIESGCMHQSQYLYPS